MQRFQDLKVWQRGHASALSIYRLSSALPTEERFGLTSQLRRAATSVPTNIAEGAKRRTRQEYARFLNISEGSLAEVEYLLLLARDLDYLSAAKAAPLLVEISELARMLNSLRAAVESGRKAALPRGHASAPSSYRL